MNSISHRVSGICGAVILVSALGGAVANADTVIRLKDAATTQTITAGKITVIVKGQSARLSPGMVALSTTRNAWVSGNITAKLSGQDPAGGAIEAGYLVGCQIDVGSAAVSVSAGATGPAFSSTDGTSIVGGTTSTGGMLSLRAGTVGVQSLTVDRKTWPKPGDEVKPDWNLPTTYYEFAGPTGTLSYSDQTIGVDGCAGYAQARLYVYVSAQIGNDEATVVLWGPPFSLG